VNLTRLSLDKNDSGTSLTFGNKSKHNPLQLSSWLQLTAGCS